MQNAPTIEFYSITDKFETEAGSTVEQMMQYALVYDSCSFTAPKTGYCIFMIVSQLSRKGIMVQIDPRMQRDVVFKPFSPTLKILGMKLSNDDELAAQLNNKTDLTVVTSGEIFTYEDIQLNFEDVRTAQPLQFSQCHIITG